MLTLRVILMYTQYLIITRINVCYLTLENSHFTQKRRDWRGGQKEFIVISVI